PALGDASSEAGGGTCQPEGAHRPEKIAACHVKPIHLTHPVTSRLADGSPSLSSVLRGGTRLPAPEKHRSLACPTRRSTLSSLKSCSMRIFRQLFKARSG